MRKEDKHRMNLLHNPVIVQVPEEHIGTETWNIIVTQ